MAPVLRDVVGSVLFRAGATRPGRAARKCLTVVTFHRVLPEPLLAEYPIPELAVTVDELEWFTAFFREHYTCGTLAEVHRRWQEGARPWRPLLAITFDDGQLDNLEHAVPVLERAGLRATFFVPVQGIEGRAPLWHDQLGFALARLLREGQPAALRVLEGLRPLRAVDDHELLLHVLERVRLLGPEQRQEVVARVHRAAGAPHPPAWGGLMSWHHVRELARRGHEIGSHSLSHASLPLLDDEELYWETSGSRTRLEAEIGSPCVSFCYPSGDCDDRVAAAVRRAGYERAVTTRWGCNAPGADPVLLSRCDIQGRRARDRLGRPSAAALALRLHPLFPGPRP